MFTQTLSLASSLIEFTNKHLLCERGENGKKLECKRFDVDMDFMYEATDYRYAAYI